VRERKITIGVIFVVMILLCVYVFVYQVDADEVAVHYRRGGELVREVNTGDEDESGLYFRWPWPIDSVKRYDKRVRVFDGKVPQTLLSDQKNVIISMHAGWYIDRPHLLQESLKGNEAEAEKRLGEAVFTETSNAIGKRVFGELVNTDPDTIKLTEIEDQVHAAVVKDLAEGRYGIRLATLQIRMLAVPRETTTAVFDRMKAERETIAGRLIEEGQTEMTRIVAEAEREAQKIISDSEADATKIRAEGEAREANVYHVFARDQGLAIFLRELACLRSIAIGTEYSLVLDLDTPPLPRLREGRGGAAPGALPALPVEVTSPADQGREGE